MMTCTLCWVLSAVFLTCSHFKSCLGDDLYFARSPAGDKFLSVKHVDIARLSDLLRIRLSAERIWMRITDPSSTKTRLSDLSKVFLRFLLRWCKAPFLLRPLKCPDLHGERPVYWDSASWRDLGLTLPDDAARAITCWETLAQMGLVVLLSSAMPGGRLFVMIRSWSDSAGAEATSNNLFTTKKPLCYFALRLAMLSWQTSIELDVHHIAGTRTGIADFLSRWAGDVSQLSDEWNLDMRTPMPISRLWQENSDVRLWPPNEHLLWDLPKAFSFLLSRERLESGGVSPRILALG